MPQRNRSYSSMASQKYDPVFHADAKSTTQAAAPKSHAKYVNFEGVLEPVSAAADKCLPEECKDRRRHHREQIAHFLHRRARRRLPAKPTAEKFNLLSGPRQKMLSALGV